MKKFKVTLYLAVFLLVVFIVYTAIGYYTFSTNIKNAQTKINKIETTWISFVSTTKGCEDLVMIPDYIFQKEILIRGVIPNKDIEVKIKKFIKTQNIDDITSIRDVMVNEKLYSIIKEKGRPEVNTL